MFKLFPVYREESPQLRVAATESGRARYPRATVMGTIPASPLQASSQGSNTASNANSSVSCRSNNLASGDLSSVRGRGDNTASGRGASVLGGISNRASGHDSSILGGQPHRQWGVWDEPDEPVHQRLQ